MQIVGCGLGFHQGTRYVSIFMENNAHESDPFIVCFSKEEAIKCRDSINQALAGIDDIDTEYYRRN